MRMRVVAWVVLMLGCGGPDDMPDGDVETDGGRLPDTSFDPGCHWDCFGRYACEGGVVVRYAHAPVPCSEWTGRCPLYPGNVDVCLEGCVEGASAPTAEAVCNENQPHAVGDPCTTDDDCQPGGNEPDGFGGTRPVTLWCEVPEGESSGLCARLSPEVCNGVDDDGDGDSDEDCAAHPRRVGEGSVPGVSGRVVIAARRIGVVSGFAGEERITVHDETGARIGEVTADLTDYQDLATDGEDLLVLLHDNYAASAEILVLGDDASVARRIALREVPSTRYLRLRPFGGQWLLYTFEGPLSRHAADGARIDGATLETADLEVAPIDGGLLATATFGGTPYATRVPIPLTAIGRPDSASMMNPSRLVTVGEVILCAAWDPSARLVRFDAASGLELERRWVGERPRTETPLPLTYAGDAAALSWRDGDVLRTLLFDSSGTEVGRTELDITGVDAPRLIGGEMAGGARVVAAGASTFWVLAPADR